MVATATMIEGSLDVLSCATLMQLAELDLPASVNGAIVIFSLLELINACQSFALQVLLSGGHDDTPLDLVKWKGMLYLFNVQHSYCPILFSISEVSGIFDQNCHPFIL